MAGWSLCSVMTSLMSVRIHGCCQRNRPLRTKHGACRRTSFRAACQSSRAVSKYSVALAPPLCSGTRATTADSGCSTLGRCALRRALLPMHLASSSATGRSTGPCTSGYRRRPCSTCLTCFRLFWSNLQMSFVTAQTSMIDVLQTCQFPFLQRPPQAAKPFAAKAVERAAKAKALVLKRPSAQPNNTELLKSSERNLVYTSGYKRRVSRLDQ